MNLEDYNREKRERWSDLTTLNQLNSIGLKILIMANMPQLDRRRNNG